LAQLKNNYTNMSTNNSSAIRNSNNIGESSFESVFSSIFSLLSAQSKHLNLGEEKKLEHSLVDNIIKDISKK